MAVNIDNMVKFRLSLFKELIQDALTTGEPKSKSLVINSHFGKWELSVAFHPVKMKIGFLLLNEEGEKITQFMEIVEEDSNLNNGAKVYYFSCNSCKCRTLYSSGKGLYPRKLFKHSYRRQRMSRSERVITPKKEPLKKYGKETYRGRLTPYGKRVQKYNEYEERREKEFIRIALKFGL